MPVDPDKRAYSRKDDVMLRPVVCDGNDARFHRRDRGLLARHHRTNEHRHSRMAYYQRPYPSTCQ